MERIVVLEKTAIRNIIVPWLEDTGYSVYIEKQFVVKGSGGRRPDIICGTKNVWSAIEVKIGKIADIQSSYKIIEYATEYRGGARYFVDDVEILITNFLVATEFSTKGYLFKDDVLPSKKWREKQAEQHTKRPFIEPYWEMQRSADFVRSVWKIWKDRDNMRNLNIGVLLSSVNDSQKTLDATPIPKMFVVHYSKSSSRWTTWWKPLCIY